VLAGSDETVSAATSISTNAATRPCPELAASERQKGARRQSNGGRTGGRDPLACTGLI
jgi:hypothetical protein